MALKVENHEVLGQRGVLIELLPYKSETVNEAGVYIPLYENYETDGGRPAARIKVDNYSTIGKVIQISKKAQELLDEDKMDIEVGDVVSIYLNAKNPSNQFLIERETPVVDFNGYLAVHPNTIQSKIINYEFASTN